nr:unnamed protein product [Callosobruchus chinensis]
MEWICKKSLEWNKGQTRIRQLSSKKHSHIGSTYRKSKHGDNLKVPFDVIPDDDEWWGGDVPQAPDRNQGHHAHHGGGQHGEALLPGVVVQELPGASPAVHAHYGEAFRVQSGAHVEHQTVAARVEKPLEPVLA